MLEEFTEIKLTRASLRLVESMNNVIETYFESGMTLTLRQLYYRLVAADLIPNTERSYKRVGRVLSDARLAGLVDWSAIVDRERGLLEGATWESPSDILGAARDGLRYDHWQEQPHAVEVWVEKKALVEVVEIACRLMRVPYMACKGYMSQTEMYIAAKRVLARASERSQTTVIVHLGDHDPSGIDMSRDIEARFRIFGANEDKLEVRRIALSREQIDEYRPPPNPAKMADSRYADYRRKHGESSWELDAIEPTELVRIIREAVAAHVDESVLEETQAREAEDRKKINRAIVAWESL
jgi:hypothetical protein